jgi:hypothetical protein
VRINGAGSNSTKISTSSVATGSGKMPPHGPADGIRSDDAVGVQLFDNHERLLHAA